MSWRSQKARRLMSLSRQAWTTFAASGRVQRRLAAREARSRGSTRRVGIRRSSASTLAGLAVCGLAGSVSRVTKLAETGMRHARAVKLVLRRPRAPRASPGCGQWRGSISACGRRRGDGSSAKGNLGWGVGRSCGWLTTPLAKAGDGGGSRAGGGLMLLLAAAAAVVVSDRLRREGTRPTSGTSDERVARVEIAVPSQRPPTTSTRRTHFALGGAGFAATHQRVTGSDAVPEGWRANSLTASAISVYNLAGMTTGTTML
ncbi:hypothetical protein ENSA5_62020 [Enhygromyxa salina]|uniref:Uncharacterized protein n=1 Tax=Enhygromyxa salina TaxID=215803 RepID=A0A2S9XD27_9BACT|nr:hypothetical protein ENSA5_62020 [Enhygromyxa salina]